MAESCATCRYFDGTHCRANPPRMIALHFQTSVGAYLESKPWSGWPLTRADDWCGAWSARRKA